MPYYRANRQQETIWIRTDTNKIQKHLKHIDICKSNLARARSGKKPVSRYSSVSSLYITEYICIHLCNLITLDHLIFDEYKLDILLSWNWIEKDFFQFLYKLSWTKRSPPPDKTPLNLREIFQLSSKKADIFSSQF